MTPLTEKTMPNGIQDILIALNGPCDNPETRDAHVRAIALSLAMAQESRDSMRGLVASVEQYQVTVCRKLDSIWEEFKTHRGQISVLEGRIGELVAELRIEVTHREELNKDVDQIGTKLRRHIETVTEWGVVDVIRRVGELETWRTGHDHRRDRDQELAAQRNWEWKTMLLRPAVAWIVAGLMAAAVVGLGVSRTSGLTERQVLQLLQHAKTGSAAPSDGP